MIVSITNRGSRPYAPSQGTMIRSLTGAEKIRPDHRIFLFCGPSDVADLLNGYSHEPGIKVYRIDSIYSIGESDSCTGSIITVAMSMGITLNKQSIKNRSRATALPAHLPCPRCHSNLWLTETKLLHQVDGIKHWQLVFMCSDKRCQLRHKFGDTYPQWFFLSTRDFRLKAGTAHGPLPDGIKPSDGQRGGASPAQKPVRARRRMRMIEL